MLKEGSILSPRDGTGLLVLGRLTHLMVNRCVLDAGSSTHRSQAKRLLGEARRPGRLREMAIYAVWSRDGRRAGGEAGMGGLQT